MKLYKLKLIVILSLLTVMFHCNARDSCGGYKPAVKVGQTWVWAFEVDNPFESPNIHKYLVLDVKDGYVKYKHLDGILKGDISSGLISFFTSCRYLETTKD